LLDFAHAIPRWNAQQGEALRAVKQVIDVRDGQLPTDLDFVAFTGVFDLHKALATPARPSSSRTPPAAPRSPAEALSAGAAGPPHQSRGNILSRVVEGLLELPKLSGLRQTHQALVTENTALKAQLAAVGAELKAARDQIAVFQRRGR
ncbi:MAG: hypothetical protein JO052_03985, partial [Bradyrhizobium sp.]|nr:hypothetical protein [Bradyrhizobium sp.]